MEAVMTAFTAIERATRIAKDRVIVVGRKQSGIWERETESRKQAVVEGRKQYAEACKCEISKDKQAGQSEQFRSRGERGGLVKGRETRVLQEAGDRDKNVLLAFLTCMVIAVECLWYRGFNVTIVYSGQQATVSPIGPDELPPPYTAANQGGVPMVTCRVCQEMIDISGKRDQHVVKCGQCNEATSSLRLPSTIQDDPRTAQHHPSRSYDCLAPAKSNPFF
ncbi:hypothetical protein PR048_033509 [Dryococelus australis]|uniref:Phosphatidylinositol-4,5-bisphosphate 4-phosphatase n=1 Tax=Dryococelus australis TaxID=614101 RepID=A0ABQ9G0I1_9NEOP|nr:hypothetical protein PR048_033509 [Dryococelus australis]